MAWSAVAGPALFVAACLVVALRLLTAARHTGGMEERAIATALLGAGVAGYGLIGAVPVLFPDLSAANLHLASCLGDLGISTGCVAIYFFTWRTFRAQPIWAEVVFFGAIALLGASFAANLARGSYALPYAERPALFHVALGVQGSSFAWGCFEALRSGIRLRRRARLGIENREVALRIFAFGAAAGSALALFVGYVVLFLRQDGLVPSADVVALLSTPGWLAAAAVWLAFFLPSGLRPERTTRDRVE